MIPFSFTTCPIECTLDSIGRKWAVNIIRDLFLGRRRFSEFLKSNPRLSSKMLSTRLKELQECGLVDKTVVETTPLLVEYGLTEKGRALGEVLYQMALFSMRHQVGGVYRGEDPHLERDLQTLRRVFCVSP
ncbi:helix-turn-helix transcriptional regulator [Candidatus Bathyarchaeota archaeon]|nr:helix-turn-helix transcriptional regulator [Candidatus Bathyarchaeota archaeon]MBL7080818.1 helix-turn-helix transcriptional regulator [Candidatus Bathyarchaeota archaeon]